MAQNVGFSLLIPATPCRPGVPVPETFRSGVSEAQVKSYAETATIYLNKALGTLVLAPGSRATARTETRLTATVFRRLHQPCDHRQGGGAVWTGPWVDFAFSASCFRYSSFSVWLVTQVALALFIIGKVGSWFTSLGLLYTGATRAAALLCLNASNPSAGQC